MAGLGSFVQGLGGGLMQGQNMALQREQLQMRKDAAEAQKAQQKQELAFKTFDLGMKLSGTDMPDSMRKKGIGMIGEAWKTLNPNSDLSFLDNMDMNNTEAKKAFKLLNTNYDKLQSGDLKMDEFQQIVRGIGQDLYGAQKKSFMEDAKALTEAKKAQADSEKLTKGTAFANKDNQRVVPMYDAQGGFTGNQVIGEEGGKTSSPATDIDDYVDRANEESIRLTGKPLTPGEKNKKALEFKRAQAREVGANRFALREVDAETAEKIKYNEGIGKNLAEIATVGAVLEAKGEVTPQKKITQAKGRMSGNLATLANHYVTLNSTGAMLNVDNSTFDNVMAASRSSAVGQAFGRITGSNEQSIRSSIKKLKPLLIQDIRQSTDMGARGLDSEKELEFYLQAATDEKTDIQSNIAAIVVLDEAFGEGKVSKQLRSLTDESLIRRIQDQGVSVLNSKAQVDIPTVTTRKEFDALKSGDEFYEDGKLYRKP